MRYRIIAAPQTDFPVIEPNSIRKSSSVEPMPPELGITPIRSCIMDENARHSSNDSGSIFPVTAKIATAGSIYRQVIFTAFRKIRPIHCFLSFITTLPTLENSSSCAIPAFAFSLMLSFLICSQQRSSHGANF